MSNNDEQKKFMVSTESIKHSECYIAMMVYNGNRDRQTVYTNVYNLCIKVYSVENVYKKGDYIRG